MLPTSIATKADMTQVFDQSGNRIAATVVNAQTVYITGQRTAEKDGYQSTQIGWATKKHIHKPVAGKLKKANIDQTLSRFIEIQADETPEIGTSYTITDVVKPGDIISVQGVTKGKGFAGTVKRWGFAGGPKTHGQTDRHRAPGSIGAGTYPGRVLKGKKMAGRMGNDRQTITNLTVLDVDKTTGTVLVSGSVPGSTGQYLVITKTGTRKDFHPIQKPQTEEAIQSSTETSESDQKSEE